VDVEKTYRVGKIIRCGSDMELTRKLLRPVHKIRFIIASHHIASAEDLKKDEDAGEEYVSFEEYVAGRNTYFMVLDNYHYGSTTQILLLQLPYTALQIAKVFGVRLTPSVLKKESLAGMDVIGTSRTDLQIKMSEPVHGHSLSTVWTAKMHQPIGFDQDARKVSLRPEHIVTKVRNEEYVNFFINYDGFPKREEFLKNNQNHKIQIAIGKVKYLDSNVIVTDNNVSEAPIKPGTCKLVSEIGKPYDYRLPVSYPAWQEREANEKKFLQSCYRSAFKIAQTNKFDSIGFTCLGLDKGYPFDIAISIAVQTTMEYMTTGKYDGNVVFCAESEAEAARFIKEIKKLI
jgi:O-acetyl-ADP-ribose deacetylase (regulator of RNase III)